MEHRYFHNVKQPQNMSHYQTKYTCTITKPIKPINKH